MRIGIAAALVVFLAASAAMGDEHKSAIQPNASFDKLKTLDGAWVGTMIESGKQYPTSTRFMMVSDGSAIMGWLAEGTPEEMVTIFHMDGKDLMATHYCAAHNQPRFVAVPSGDPNRVVFKFKDGTNIGAHDGHMQEVAFIFDGPDHHVEEWTYLDGNGKLTTGRFDFTRKK
ncbi:MAG TPA: hypothetical protein VL240_01615 [Candidatus Binatia bacterium]|nr:hypothetical protein [Candidatus Binatia bacterium]